MTAGRGASVRESLAAGRRALVAGLLGLLGLLGIVATAGAQTASTEDDLQWLEAPQSVQALDWARTATQRLTRALQASARFKPLLEELLRLNRSVGPVADIGLVGHRAVRLHKTAEHPKGLLQAAALSAEGLGPWRTLLDVGALGRREGRDFVLTWRATSCLAPQFERCLLSLHDAGGDESELREFDLVTGGFVNGGFALAKSRTVATWVDGQTLLLGHTLGTAPRTATGWPAQALLWTCGTPVTPDRLQVEIRRAPARDGQNIEYLVVGPRARQPGPTPTPTLMTGYGAFGFSMTPAHFSTALGALYGGATLKLWLDRGGALVVPAIRGGGEGGAAWHQAAALRERRQTSYDDFHAVAESLIAAGYTDRRRLGVFGLSNGGLLAAVAGTQRPDLYGAVVSDVPLADMLRFPQMGMGAAWISEYGDPKDPKAAEWLRGYSPVHHVRQGPAYPPFLITAATTDNRVGPGHARKLAHCLLAVGATVHYLEPEVGGHGVSDPLQAPEVMAMPAAFLIDQLMVTGP